MMGAGGQLPIKCKVRVLKYPRKRKIRIRKLEKNKDANKRLISCTHPCGRNFSNRYHIETRHERCTDEMCADKPHKNLFDADAKIIIYILESCDNLSISVWLSLATVITKSIKNKMEDLL